LYLSFTRLTGGKEVVKRRQRPSLSSFFLMLKRRRKRCNTQKEVENFLKCLVRFD
jgi:hypothetical protein